MSQSIDDATRRELLPEGHLRAGINMTNILLVTSEDDAGNPAGVSPDLARAMADELGVELELIAYPGPGAVADAVNDWDIGNIAAEAERARTIAFSHPYSEIQAVYLVPEGSTLATPADVDQAGIRIAAKERAAYELWLKENLKNATIVNSDSMEGAWEVFQAQSLDALAGLRAKLTELAESLPGSRVIDEPFTAIQQSVGCPLDRPLAAAWIDGFVRRALESGLVADLIEKHGVAGKLAASPLHKN